jgi:long-subunit fatty acid transport protein
MRRLLTFVTAALVTGTLFAGGLVTNTNQSATWARMPSRNASVKADAVYYNPAGLMMMDNGLHLSLSNQTIFQKRTIESTYTYLNSGTYEGSVTAPFFPSIYAAYKLDRIAFSVGFMPSAAAAEQHTTTVCLHLR